MTTLHVYEYHDAPVTTVCFKYDRPKFGKKLGEIKLPEGLYQTFAACTLDDLSAANAQNIWNFIKNTDIAKKYNITSKDCINV